MDVKFSKNKNISSSVDWDKHIYNKIYINLYKIVPKTVHKDEKDEQQKKKK